VHNSRLLPDTVLGYEGQVARLRRPRFRSVILPNPCLHLNVGQKSRFPHLRHCHHENIRKPRIEEKKMLYAPHVFYPFFYLLSPQDSLSHNLISVSRRSFIVQVGALILLSLSSAGVVWQDVLDVERGELDLISGVVAVAALSLMLFLYLLSIIIHMRDTITSSLTPLR
jgi:hypothetical protein